MDSEIDEVNQAIAKGFEEFKKFIELKINQDENYLGYFFWTPPNGEQVTILNHLIQMHNEPDSELTEFTNLLEMIDYVLQRMPDKNSGEPLHQAIQVGKIALGLHFLDAESLPLPYDEEGKLQIKLFLEMRDQEKKTPRYAQENSFNYNSRNLKQRTLLSLAIASRRIDLLFALLLKHPNVNIFSYLPQSSIAHQPLHDAIKLDFADGVRLLAAFGAQLDNPVGSLRNTPVLMAAHLGKVNALDALLEQPYDRLKLEAQNRHGRTAIEELGIQLVENKNKTPIIAGIAMLLCRGAEPPRSEEMRALLSANRALLMAAIDKYLINKPDLVDDFVNRCHVQESALHNIMYADYSWRSSFRYLRGTPSQVGFFIERLVMRKYNDAGLCNPLILYAQFVRRYEETYMGQRITNPWSPMLWKIAEGKISDWGEVRLYAQNHPNSRTAIILSDMECANTSVHSHTPTSNSPTS